MTMTPPTIPWVADASSKRKYCGRNRGRFVAKVGFVMTIVFLTCNSLFWFPFLEKYDEVSPISGLDDKKNDEMMSLPIMTSTSRGKNRLEADSTAMRRSTLVKPAQDKTSHQNNVTTHMATTTMTETVSTAQAKAKTFDTPINATTSYMKGNKNIGNKTLVILIGNLRCGENAWQSLYRNLLDVNSADLGLIGTNDDGGRYPNASLFSRAKYVWKTPEYDEWADALDLINGTSWRTTVLPQISKYSLSKGLLGGIFKTPSSGAIQNMMRWWLSNHIRNDPSMDDYDIFVVTRTDQYYGCVYNINDQLGMRTGDVYIPRGEDYSGVCDRFMVVIGGKEKLLQALDVLPPFLNDYDPKLYGKLHNPEGLLEVSLKRKKLKVRRTQRVMFTCASSDGRDHSRWRKTTAALLLSSSNASDASASKVEKADLVSRHEYGVDRKYKHEFSRARFECVQKPKNMAKEAAAKKKGLSKN